MQVPMTPGANDPTRETAAASIALPGNASWLTSAAHQSWATDQAVRLLEFFRASIDDRGWFVELDDDGQPLLRRDDTRVEGGRSVAGLADLHSQACSLVGTPLSEF
jgi:hypothetical protein